MVCVCVCVCPANIAVVSEQNEITINLLGMKSGILSCYEANIWAVIQLGNLADRIC